MPSTKSNSTPFDEHLDRGDDAPPPTMPLASDEAGDGKRNRDWPRLWSLRQVPHATQLGLMAVAGALAVVLLSALISYVAPRFAAPRPHGSHPVAGSMVQGSATRKASGGAAVVQTQMPQSPHDGSGVYISSEKAMEVLGGLTEEERERLQARRREEQIIAETRLLEDKKRAIERQLEDKQLEEKRRLEDQAVDEQRRADDKKREEDRLAQDKKKAEERRQEEQRQSEEGSKLAEAP